MNNERISRSEWAEWHEKLARATPTFENSRLVSRDLSVMFGNFCKISGTVLDVGSGPRRAPYLESAHCELCVGLDPLPTKEPSFDLVCGVGEFLPFRSGIFDQCLCGTSLEHCVRPEIVLKEMRRITKDEGKINLWIGTFDRPRQKLSRMSSWAEDAHDGWTLLRKGSFGYLGKACRIRFSKSIAGLSSHIRIRLGLTSDPYHLHSFRDRDVNGLLRRSRLSVVERRKLADGSLFLTVR